MAAQSPTIAPLLSSVSGPADLERATRPPELPSFPSPRRVDDEALVDGVSATASASATRLRQRPQSAARRTSRYVFSPGESPLAWEQMAEASVYASASAADAGISEEDAAAAAAAAAALGLDPFGQPVDAITLARARAAQDQRRWEQEKALAEALAGPLAPLVAAAEEPDAGAEAVYLLGSSLLKGVGMRGLVGGRRRAEVAFPHLLRSAESGYALAQYAVGVCYAHGDGVGRDVGRAAGFFRLAAERGDADAQWRLAHCLLSGAGVGAIDVVSAFGWFRRAARQGHPKACYDLGVSLLRGEGCDVDEPQAFSWLLKSAEQGYAEAQSDLAQCLFEGVGCETDQVAAVAWWRKAADKGIADAKYQLGECHRTGAGRLERDEAAAARLYAEASAMDHPRANFRLGVALCHGLGVPRDTAAGFALLMRAAEADVMLAQIEVAHAYQHGLLGLKRDLVRAVEWYRFGAAHGHSEACYQLGVLYSRGVAGALDKDVEQGLQWVLKAAAVGHVEAQFHAGVCFELGEGTQTDFAQAAAWYRRAADKRHTLACNALGSCYLEAKGLPRDTGLAAAWFGLAAAKGIAEAQFRLGTFCDSGDGADLDKVAAARWFHRAAEQNYPDAQHRLGQAFERGIGVTKDAALAVAWYKKAVCLQCYPAFLSLALCYERGVGVARDHVQSFALLKLMADSGSTGIFLDAYVGCGRLLLRGEAGLERNVAQGLRWYLRAAQNGHAAAQCQIGCWHLDGEMVAHGVEKRIVKAAHWLQLSADQNQPDAIANLGLCFARDELPMWERDVAKAIACFRRAGEMGVALAQCCLGVYYKNGEGVPRDMAKAAALYKLAAEQGNKEAEYNLSKCFYYGDGLERDRGQAAVLERRAALQGHPEAQFRVGYRFHKGDAVDRDAATAFGWYSKSALQGFGLAQYNLALCFLMGDGTPDGVRDEKQARFWMRKAEQNGLQQAEEALRTNFASLGQSPEQMSGRAPSPGPERRARGGRGANEPPRVDDFPVVGFVASTKAVHD